MQSARVLIVEDNLTIAGNLYDYLQSQGFVPDVAYDGKAALAMLGRQAFDVIVLDIGLPGGLDGYGVLRALRTDLRQPTPVLVLTARDGLDDKLTGFSHGADDYLTKPFALAEVKARLTALVQRSRHAVVDSVFRFGPLSLDSGSREVCVNGKPVHLARKSVQIVEMLLRDPGRVVTREALETVLWGDEPPASDALRSQVHLLRRALAEAGFDGIETVHGTGWRLTETA